MRDGKGGELRMGKKLMLLSGIALFAFTVSFAGCSKKEEPPPPPPPPAPAPAAPAPSDQSAAPAPSGGDQKAGDQSSGGAPMEKKDEGSKTK